MLRVWHGLCQQLRGRYMGTRGSGFWPCPAHPQGQRLKSRRESSGSVTVSVWKFLLTPQTAALGPPGPYESVSYRSGPTPPAQPGPPDLLATPLPAPPATEPKTIYSLPGPLAPRFTPAQVPPQTLPRQLEGREQ